MGTEKECMRIRVTDRNNMICKYGAEKEKNMDKSNDPSREELLETVRKAVGDGISRFKIAGGEPILREDIVELVSDIKAIEGVEEISMTTNGTLLGWKAEALAAAGLDRVNINVDTLRYMRFDENSDGGNLEDIVSGINAATDNGLKPVKLNVKVMKGFNDDEVLDFLQLTFQHEYEVRFVELSEEEEKRCGFEYVPTEELMKKMPALRPVQNEDGTNLFGRAYMYKYPGGRGKIGFIKREMLK